jgi:phage tail sheath protein FI
MMAQLLHPGVYTRELPPSVRPIQGVSTSTAAFIGVTDKGPIPQIVNGQRTNPTLVTSFTQYSRIFGGFRADSFLTYSVKAFFDNGGSRAYIIRVAPSGAAKATYPSGSPPSGPVGAGALPIQASSEGVWGNSVWVGVDRPSTLNDGSHFKLVVMTGASATDAVRNVVESYDDLAFTDAQTIVNRRSEFIRLTAALTAQPTLPGGPSLPTGSSALTPVQLINGSDGIGTASNVGSQAVGTGLFALDKVTDVNLIAVPGDGSPATVNAGMAYCKNSRPLQDCFFIGDVGSLSPSQARNDAAQTDTGTVALAQTFATTGTGTPLDKSSGDYGAIYYPWVFGADPLGVGSNPRILLPPSGFVAGIYARTDGARGVFKAPAGAIDGGVSGALAPAYDVGDLEQDALNPVNVNVIRTVPGSGVVIWGTRTIGSDPGWRYIPIRRLAIYLRVSIYYGIQWSVFEPNDEPLWSSLRLNIRSFMLTQFRAGAFQGSKPDDAFFVLCDSSTTTQTDIDNGVVNIQVGFAPLKPAEFVVMTLSQKVNQPAA